MKALGLLTYDALNDKEVKTDKGFIGIKAAMVMSAADNSTGFPAPEKMFSVTNGQMAQARASGRLVVVKWRATKKAEGP